MLDAFLHTDSTPAVLLTGKRQGSRVFRFSGVRGSVVKLRVYFIENKDFVTPDVAAVTLELKQRGQMSADALLRAVASTPDTDGVNDFIEIDLDLSGTEIDELLNASGEMTKTNFILAGQLKWENGAGDIAATRIFAAEVVNDLVKELSIIPKP